MKSAVAEFWISSRSIFSIVTGASKILCSTLEADTTTSLPSRTDSDMVIFRSDVLEEIVTSCVSYPTIENTNVAGDSETFKLKLPSLSETVPSTLPLTNIFTPISPPLSSDTFPEIETL